MIQQDGHISIRLSPEILRLISQCLCSHCRGELELPHWAEPRGTENIRQQDTRTLFNLCLVSRQFRDISQEILYHQFNPRYATSQSPSPWARRLEPFLKTIASRPNLARSVKAVFLSAPLIQNLDFCDSREAFRQCARALGTNTARLWQERQLDRPWLQSMNYRARQVFFVGDSKPHWLLPSFYRNIIIDELLAMVVSLLPKLTHLRLDKQVDLSASTIKSLGLTRLALKTLEVEGPVNSLLSLTPDLDTLVTRGYGRFTNVPSIKTLHVVGGERTSVTSIESLLSVCTSGLCTFSCTAVKASEHEILELLDQKRLRDNLESVHLDLRFQLLPGQILHTSPVPSFKAFENLKILFLTNHSIYTTRCPSLDDQTLTSILPPAIESLTLVDHDKPTPPERIREGLLGLAKAAPTFFKQLKLIRCDSEQACDDNARGMFKSIDIDLLYQQFPRRDWSYARGPIAMHPEEALVDVEEIPLPGELSDDYLHMLNPISSRLYLS